MAALLQLMPQVEEVINLPIEDDPDRFVLIGQGCRAASERSMIFKRQCPRKIDGDVFAVGACSTSLPLSSGPRCQRRSIMRWPTPTSTGCPCRLSTPQMPHMVRGYSIAL
jgi:hypothetical protein